MGCHVWYTDIDILCNPPIQKKDTSMNRPIASSIDRETDRERDINIANTTTKEYNIWQFYLSLLSPADRNRITNLRQVDDQKRAILSVLLQKALIRYLWMYLSIYLSIYLSSLTLLNFLYLSIYLSIRKHLDINDSEYTIHRKYLSIYLSIYLTSLSISLSIYLCIYLFMYLQVLKRINPMLAHP
jgi:hypothetical protein